MSTQESRRFIEFLDDQIKLSDERIKTAREPFERGLWFGYKDAYQLCRDYAVAKLPEIEAAAFLLPPVEEDLRERLMREEFGAAA